MLDFLTSILAQPIVQASLVGLGLLVIGWIVKRTKTKRDDQIWAVVQEGIFSAFSLAEKVIPSGKPNSAKNKLNKALKEFSHHIVTELKRSPSADEIQIAKAIWAKTASELKKK